MYDSTLREGSQKTGLVFSMEDKLRILERLIHDLHIPMVEAGWPGSNPKDIEFFQKIKETGLNGTNVYAFGSTRRKNSSAESDKSIQAILNADVKGATIFGKTWDLHVEAALETSLEENLAMIEDTIKCLKNNNLDVIFDAEHFFDGYKNNRDYALKCLNVAKKAGVSWIVLCDTNGGMLPHELRPILSDVRNHLGNTELGIHAHNDTGMANAMALEAFLNGAKMIQGTINGFGERCGNTDLTTILPVLKLKMNVDCISDEDLQNLTEVSHFIYEMANLSGNPDQPFVGKNAFSHKGGVHASAILKNSKTYEHINPDKVGNVTDIKISELAGKSSLLHMANKFNIPLTVDSPKIRVILDVLKEKEHQGYSFEGAEGSLEILMRSMDMNIQDPNYYRNKFFELEGFRVLTEKFKDNLISEATIKVKVGDERFHTAAEGNGPVNALDNALKKALVYFYPSIKEIDLSDFKVRIIAQAGTASVVRVLAETHDQESAWGTIGAHENIIVASWDALVDSYIFKLLKNKANW
ncbi:MAG: citramalate synthase [Candidatus Lokiarchaeota archaeon]|nr:citramalate synthase [Candidatus Lokiarchaeota archaeon]